VLCLLIAAGCLSYEPNKYAEGAAEPNLAAGGVIVKDGSVEVRFLPLFRSDVAVRFLGINPSRVGMLPAMLRIDNRSGKPLKVDLASSYLKTASDERWSTIGLSDATSRALAGDAKTVDALALGVVPCSGFVYLSAADAYGKKCRTLEEDYHAKSFKPTLINDGESGRGIVFFEFPQGTQSIPGSLLLRFSSPAVGRDGEVRVELPASVFE